MLVSIRRGVFETNSSSVHSLTICENDEYQKWVEGELYFSRWIDNKFMTKEEIKEVEEKYLSKPFSELCDDDLEDLGYYTYDGFWDYVVNCDFEAFEEEKITKSGDKVHAFGYFGRDG